MAAMSATSSSPDSSWAHSSGQERSLWVNGGEERYRWHVAKDAVYVVG